MSLRVNYFLIAVSLVLIVISFSMFIKINKKAHYDSLTQLLSRHGFTDYLSTRTQTGIVLMIDIDDFKKVNDTYGHSLGDEVLKALSQVFVSHIRKQDYAVRWGGEEFLILLNEISLEVAESRAGKLLEHVRQISIREIHVTISIGISELNHNWEEAINKADQALYQAKSNGKNQIVIERAIDERH